MKIVNHPISLALGTSTLCLLSLIAAFVSPTHSLIYHLSGPSRPLFASMAIIWCLLWLSLSGLFALAEKFTGWKMLVWSSVLLLMPWVLLKNFSKAEDKPIPYWTGLLVLFLPSAFFLGLFCFRRASFHRVFDFMQRLAATLLGFVSLVGLLAIGEFSVCAWQARNLNPPFVPTDRQVDSVSTRPRTRIIWIMLDELSYQQVYELRFPGLQLPAFDQFATQSTVFTHVVPAGIFTQEVVPSLFTGSAVDQIRVSAQGGLQSLHNPVSGDWHEFDPHQTVFEDARALSYSTGVAGWINPYCRILPQVLDRCFWVYRNSGLGYLQPDQSLIVQITGPFRSLLEYSLRAVHVWDKPTTPSNYSEVLHLEDFKDIRAAADVMLADRSVDFLFLHLPIPHPGGIYDRRRMTFATSGASYLDNLVLADQYLAHVRLLLEQHNQWDSSAVIVMGDHSWRTQLIWSSDPRWTPEENQASHGGKFDDRPAYIVKMPMQQGPLRVDTPFRAVHTRAMLDGIMSGSLKTGQDLQAWAEKQP